MWSGNGHETLVMSPAGHVRRTRKDHEAMLAEHRWALGVFARFVIARSEPGTRHHFSVLTAAESPTATYYFLRG
jgi:hypothetical protein